MHQELEKKNQNSGQGDIGENHHRELFEWILKVQLFELS